MDSVSADLLFPHHHSSHQFDIGRDGDGLWRVEDREGLIGGIFRTRKAAFRFAMFEADWDRTCIHFHTSRHHGAREAGPREGHQS
jgi:hypothetical protein